MSNRMEYAEAKRLLNEIHYELQTQPLTLEQRRELELHAAALAGVLARPWFPQSWTRQLLMAAIVLFGVHQAWTGNYQPMLWWLLLPLFSPRIVGECAHFIGRCAGFLRSAH